MNRHPLVACLIASVACTAVAQGADLPARTTPDGVWTLLDQMPVDRAAGMEWIRPMHGQGIALNPVALERTIAQIPIEFTQQAAAAPAIVTLPAPDGGFVHFTVVESPVMAPELAAKFPDIRTFVGQGVEDRAATLRMDSTPLGFHAQVLSPDGAWYIDPWSRNDNVNYTSYYKRDYVKANDGWQCLTQPAEVAVGHGDGSDLTRAAISLRTYRLACAADGEYTAFFGGTVALGQAAVVTAVNRVTGVYETELAVRMTLVANNSSIIYTNASTDPYTNNNGSAMLTQNQTVCDIIIGSANYDIGHVFSTGGGGVAFLGVVCGASKAGGVTGLGSPTGDAFWIDYVAHEMGHQFGANHTFNSTTGSCSGNRSASHAYEPGSGSTIMAYAGICGADDLQPHSDPYMAFDSLIAINAYIQIGTGNVCPVKTSAANDPPTANAGAAYTIPISTPFALTGSGTDPNGDALTYCWEENDLGPATTLAAADNGSSPIFRSFNPTTSPTRTFPKLSSILSGSASLGEKLPTTSRTMTFRLTTRDNWGPGGGTGSDTTTVTSTTLAGPFAITSPNTSGLTFSGSMTVNWNVANTSAAPVSCANVNIYLSTDGGNTWPTVLAAGTPNDGSAVVTLPQINTSTARIKVQGAGNIFFDINNANFTITTPANNECANATVITCNSFERADLAFATTAPSDPAFTCRFGGSAQGVGTVWFKFVATGATARLITSPVTGGAAVDTLLAVYSGSCGALTQIACNDDINTGTSNFLSAVDLTGLSVGSTYYVQVAAYSDSRLGTYDLVMECPGDCVNCPAGSYQEAEACGADTNGGCNSTPTAYEDIPCNASFCGTSTYDGGTRDTDWFRLTLQTAATVKWCVTAQFPVQVFILNTDCTNITAYGNATGSACQAACASAILSPGTYYLFVAPQFSSPPIECNDAAQWQASLTITPLCPGDFNGDGLVNTLDLAMLLRVFGTSVSSCSKFDSDHNGFINTFDLADFLHHFGNICIVDRPNEPVPLDPAMLAPTLLTAPASATTPAQ